MEAKASVRIGHRRPVVPLGETRELMPEEGAQMWAGRHLRLQALQTRQISYQAPESPR